MSVTVHWHAFKSNYLIPSIQIPVKYKEEVLTFEGITLMIAGNIVCEYNSL